MGGPRGRLISDSDRVTAVELINEARENGARLEPACDELNISVRTYQRWTKYGEVKKDQRPLIDRPIPKNKLSDEEREEKMNTHRARTSPPVKREPPTHIAIAPNQVWTWDITWLKAVIKGHYYKLYLIIYMFSRLIVAYEVWEEERAEHAEYLIRKATLSQGIAGKPLVLYPDNGSPMKAATI